LGRRKFFGSKTWKKPFPQTAKDCVFLKELVEAERIKTVIRRGETGQKKGNGIITF
jgi:hypothetical protein